MNIVKDMAVTASLALNAMVCHTASDVYKIDPERQEYELFVLQGGLVPETKTTELAKYYLLHPQEGGEEFGKQEARLLSFVHRFASEQVDLDDDFLAALDQLEEKSRNPYPKRVRF